MTCQTCGRNCFEPHDIDSDPGECCIACGEILEYCICQRCHFCSTRLTAEERPDDVCKKCLVKYQATMYQIKGGNL